MSTHTNALYPSPLAFFPALRFSFFRSCGFSESAVQVRTSSAVWLQAELHAIVHYTYTESLYVYCILHASHVVCVLHEVPIHKWPSCILRAPTHILMSHICLCRQIYLLMHMHILTCAQAQSLHSQGQMLAVLPAADSQQWGSAGLPLCFCCCTAASGL